MDAAAAQRADERIALMGVDCPCGPAEEEEVSRNFLRASFGQSSGDMLVEVDPRGRAYLAAALKLRRLPWLEFSTCAEPWAEMVAQCRLADEVLAEVIEEERGQS